MSEPLPSPPRLPAEIVADIVELAILTSSPCPRIVASPPAADHEAAEPRSPFNTPLRSTYISAWSWTSQLLYVSKFIHSIARPLLLQTLTLDTPRAARCFFDASQQVSVVKRAWLGNLTAAMRDGEMQLDPIELKLREAAWYEECSSGFVVGHAYASRLKPKRKKRGKERERQYRNVSVYWAEEELVEEVSDPERSSDSDSDESDDVVRTQSAGGFARSLPSASTEARREVLAVQQRRASHQESSTREWRMDQLHEPAWQTLYSRRRSPMRNGRVQTTNGGLPLDVASSSVGPSEGDLDPWDMQDAQERLTALANTSVDTTAHSNASTSSSSTPSPTATSSPTPTHKHPRREIYAYHLCTATLEAFINPLLSSIRSLRLITITFYPGHLLDDDKLEHMLRRILSPSECPRLQTLLIRIVFDAASAGSRMRRFERTKTIAGAADRIGDERVRVMLVHNRVGEGELVAQAGGDEASEVNPVSRKAIMLTKEGWWSRVLQQNHLPTRVSATQDEQQAPNVDLKAEQQLKLSNWSLFLPPSQHANPTHLVNLIHHSDPWPDCPNPVS